jgi:hypothetical protein
LRTGFRPYELPALGGAVVLIAAYLTGTPTGLAVTLIVSGLILARAGSWWRRNPGHHSSNDQSLGSGMSTGGTSL